MNHRRCCGFPICSRREKGGAWLSTSGVWDLVGGLLEPGGEKGMHMRSRCFFKPFFLLG